MKSIEEYRATKDKLTTDIIRLEEKIKTTDEKMERLTETLKKDFPEVEEFDVVWAEKTLSDVHEQIKNLEIKINEAEKELEDEISIV